MFVWSGTTLSHFSHKLLKRAAFAADPPDKEFEVVLLREQYRSLARFAPYLFGAMIAAAATVGVAMRGVRSPPYALIAPAALLIAAALVVALRLTSMRPRDLQTAFIQRRAVRAVTILGPGLALAFTVATALALPHTYVVQRSLLLFALWIIAVASAFCLTRLAHAAALVIFCSSAPVIVALLIARDGLTFSLAALLLIVSCLVIVMLSENYRSFEDILRAHFVIAAKHRASEDARRQATAIAHTDYLTGLPNRRWLQSWLASRIEAATDSPRPFAIGLLDLDGFKPINDMHCHLVGDEILRQVGARIAASMLGRGHAARMGGDEFAVVVEGAGSADDALAIGRRVQSAFAEPFLVDQKTVHLTCTCGFALFPELATEAEELVRLADVALYRAKANRRGDMCVFNPGDANAAMARATVEQALHRAVAERSIDVSFQPVVDLQTGRVNGFETLARWRDPRLGSVAPSVFIPLAEHIGLIDQLSHDLLRKAAAAAARWPGDVWLSFNLSPEQLSQRDAGEKIVAALREVGLPPTRFEVEVTETAIMRNLEAARATIATLRAAGIRIALDDFGAGYSSLAQVRDLALDRVKIDKSFVERICEDRKIASLTRAILDMCLRLGLPCVAEGIERPDQLEELRLGGCAAGQGWLFARPLSEANAARFIEERRSAAE